MNPFIARLLTDVPLIHGGTFLKLIDIKPGIQAAEHPWLKEKRAEMKPEMTVTGDGFAIVPIEGILARKPDVYELFHGTEDSLNVLEMTETAAADPAIKGILFAIDSPGGYVTGGPEIADAIRLAGKQKPTVTHVGGMMCSLACWIGVQSNQVVASRSAIVGSIGAFTAHIDMSQYYADLGISVEVIRNKEGTYKAAGAFGTTLTDAQRQNLQDGVQSCFAEFRKAVRAARPGISDDAMAGQTFSGTEAKSIGLVDRVGGQPFALSVLRSLARSAGGR